LKRILLLLITTFALSSCDKDNDKPQNPLDKLPPATQTGANTFGCLLDGNVFKPSNAPNSINCFYQLVSGEYYFLVSVQRTINYNLVSIVLKTDKKQIFQGGIYQLYENIDGNASGNYLFNLDISSTTLTNTGELKITKLDLVNQIVSGTFSFDIEDTNGVIHQIREGRFDMQFTQ